VTNASFATDPRWLAAQDRKVLAGIRTMNEMNAWLRRTFAGSANDLPVHADLAPGVRIATVGAE
jgi:hypothetical protein